MTDDQAAELLEAIDELRAELRRIRRDGLVARLSQAERDEIAAQVFERVDERLAPAETRQGDEPPRKRAGGGKGFFRGAS
jgi:hypothetical protein